MLLQYDAGSTEFTSHQDDRRRQHSVVVISIITWAFIVITDGRDGEVLHRVHVGPGDVYALTGDALTKYYHSVQPDPAWTGKRYASTMRTTKWHLDTQWEPQSQELKCKREEQTAGEVGKHPVKQQQRTRAYRVAQSTL